MRVCLLVWSTQVAPGATVSLSGASGPDGRRRCTVTDSGEPPGLKMSISLEAPAASCAWGMNHRGSGAAEPGTTARPIDVPRKVCTSDATTRPVRAETTELTVDASWTSAATFSPSTWPGCRTIPW